MPNFDSLSSVSSDKEAYQYMLTLFKKAHFGNQNESLQTVFSTKIGLVGHDMFKRINRSRTFKRHSTREFLQPKAGAVKEIDWKNPVYFNATLRMQVCKKHGWSIYILTDCPCGWPEENYSFVETTRNA